MHAVLYYSYLNKYIPTDNMMSNHSENDEENSTKRKYTYTLNIYGYKWIKYYLAFASIFSYLYSNSCP